MTYSYVIVFESLEKDDVRNLKNLLEDIGDTYANINYRKNTATIDSSEPIQEIFQVLEENGYSVIDVEMK